MNQVRTFLLFAWLLVGFLIWEAWQRDYAAPQLDATRSSTTVTDDAVEAGSVDPGLIPTAPSGTTVAADAVPGSAAPSRELVVVESDLLRLSFDPQGASLVRAELLAYPESTDKDAEPVELLTTDTGQYFVAQSGWVSSGGPAPTHLNPFAVQAGPRALSDGADRIEIPFLWTDAETGRQLRRTWIIERGSYLLTQRDEWTNPTATAIAATPYLQLLREPPPKAGGGFTNPAGYSFVGAAWYSPGEKFNKIAYDDFADEPLDASAAGGWIAMLQHYFFAAWIPDADEAYRFSNSQIAGNRYLMRAMGSELVVPAGGTASDSSRLYVGPKLQEQLAAIAPGLERTIDYGVLTLLAEPLFWLLSLFHSLVGNWGWAIVMLVILIKAAFFKLSEAQYKSFAKMRRVQPRIDALKERYGDDRTKFNAAMMELYQKEKINPMGGCLPILVQIPVFISLYWVLLESVELRQAPWFGWIQNLTAPDPYFILPVLNLVTMWLTQKLSPAPGMDPIQRRMMQAMPLVFGVLFAFFPAGLVLYWTVNGALGLLQQWIITRRHGEPPAKAA